jgi:hypothetical protein
VAIEVKEKARKSDKKFFEQLQQLLIAAQKQRLTLNPDTK